VDLVGHLLEEVGVLEGRVLFAAVVGLHLELVRLVDRPHVALTREVSVHYGIFVFYGLQRQFLTLVRVIKV